MTFRFRIYRFFARAILGMGKRWNLLPSCGEREKVKKKAQAWFHAASAGELETLIPVIEKWCELGKSCVVSVFSSSGLGVLNRLSGALESKGQQALLQAVLSPWEGHWGNALLQAQPSCFVSVKYEAWPELWAELALQKIPLVILGAQSRSSLRWVQRILRFFGMPLPRIQALGFKEDADLRSHPAYEFMQVKDPRYERISERAKNPVPRVAQIQQASAFLSKPWGILAQVWEEDLCFWEEELKKQSQSPQGTFWIVPHRLDPESLQRLKKILIFWGMRWVPSRELSSSEKLLGISAPFVFVDEPSVLADLYRFMDWCYVGGGWGAGVHSVLEPAYFGLPICAGIRKEWPFPEFDRLKNSGQLVFLSKKSELRNWHESRALASDECRDQWQLQFSDQRGGGEEVLNLLMRPLSSYGNS